MPKVIIPYYLLVKCVYWAVYLKEVVIMKERSVVLQLSLLGFFYLILPLLFQFCYTLKTQEIIRHSRALLGSVQGESLNLFFLDERTGFLVNLSYFDFSIVNLYSYCISSFSRFYFNMVPGSNPEWSAVALELTCSSYGT